MGNFDEQTVSIYNRYSENWDGIPYVMTTGWSMKLAHLMGTLAEDAKAVNTLNTEELEAFKAKIKAKSAEARAILAGEGLSDAALKQIMPMVKYNTLQALNSKYEQDKYGDKQFKCGICGHRYKTWRERDRCERMCEDGE